MPHVDPAHYTPGIPDGAFHLDNDDTHDYRLPRTLDDDFLLYQLTRALDQSLYWVVRQNARELAREPTAAELAAAPGLLKD